jgi:hypothetical protein
LHARMALDRVVVAELPGACFGILLARASAEAARGDLRRLLAWVREDDRLVTAGWLSIDAAGLPAMSEHELIRMAESIVGRQAGRELRPRVEGISIRCEGEP